jgi:SAM-dependent methyltransferase
MSSATRRATLLLTLLLSLGGYLTLHYSLVRGDLIGSPKPSDAAGLLGLFAGLFVLYGLALRLAKDPKDFSIAMIAGLIFRIALIFCLPNLSDDFYRFVWDGRMMHLGINPFSELPSDFMARIGVEASQGWQDLYPHLNSQNYHSVYPPVLQGVFWFATKVTGGDLWGSIVVMKLCVVLAEVGTLYFLHKLVTRWFRKESELPRKAVLLYALNPMVISELAGNLHFEAFMIFFFLGAIWLLTTKRMLPAAAMLALAIGSKLLPVLVFPFLIRRLGWVRVFVFGILTGLMSLGLFALFLDAETLPNFLASIRLYFQAFEFNSGIYYFFRGMLGSQGFWVNRILPWVVMGIILMGAWKERERSGSLLGWQGLPTMVLFALTVYQITAPVIHPWYITSLVAFSVLSKFRFPILWSFLLPFSYMAYYFPGYEQQTWYITVEFIVLLIYIAYEWSFKSSGLTLEEWMLRKPLVRNFIRRSIPARMKIKYERIARHLSPDNTILDIGTGNGGLVKGLRDHNFTVETVDVKNISFFPDIQPVVYDGETLPFEDKTFDSCTIVTVLHHTPSPEAILDEALRVTRKRIVIMEDIYRNPLQKHLTYFVDSLVNLEFADHPHTNKSDAEWRALFAEKGLKLVFREDFRTLVFFRQVVYVVEI